MDESFFWWNFVGCIIFLFVALIVTIAFTSLSSASPSAGLGESEMNVQRSRNYAMTRPSASNGGLLTKSSSISSGMLGTPYNNLTRNFVIVVLPTARNSGNATIRNGITTLSNNISNIVYDLNTQATECANTWYPPTGGTSVNHLNPDGSNLSQWCYTDRSVPVFKPGVIPIFIGCVNYNAAYYGYHDYFSEDVNSFPFSNYENTIITTQYQISKFTPFIFIDCNALAKYPLTNLNRGNSYGIFVNALTVTTSHEICETIVNPYVSNFTSDGNYYTSRGTSLGRLPNSSDAYAYLYFWFVEASDAVQTDSNGRAAFYLESRNTAVSDWLYPNYFDSGNSSSPGVYDRCGLISGRGYDASGRFTSSMSRVAIAPNNGSPTSRTPSVVDGRLEIFGQ